MRPLQMHLLHPIRISIHEECGCISRDHMDGRQLHLWSCHRICKDLSPYDVMQSTKGRHLHRLKRGVYATMLRKVYISTERDTRWLRQSSVLLETSLELSELRLPQRQDRGNSHRNPQFETPWQKPRQLQGPSLHPESQSQPITRATVLHQVDPTLQSNMTRPAPTHHNLHSTSATNANASSTRRPPQQSDADLAPAVQRWIEKPMRESSHEMALGASLQRWRPPSKTTVPEEGRREATVLRLGLMSAKET